jgi:hypothetical protein
MTHPMFERITRQGSQVNAALFVAGFRGVFVPSEPSRSGPAPKNARHPSPMVLYHNRKDAFSELPQRFGLGYWLPAAPLL